MRSVALKIVTAQIKGYTYIVLIGLSQLIVIDSF